MAWGIGVGVKIVPELGFEPATSPARVFAVLAYTASLCDSFAVSMTTDVSEASSIIDTTVYIVRYV